MTGSRDHLRRLAAQSRRHLWYPFTQMAGWNREPPLMILRGKGPVLWGHDGRRYLDGTSSLWVNVHGHRHPELDRAVEAQLRRIAHSTLLGLSHPPAIELAAELTRRAPSGLTRVFYSDNGSTAVEVALKQAFQFWQQSGKAGRRKRTFISFANAYHGDTLGAVSVGGIDLFHHRFAPLLFPTLKVHAPYCYRCPLGLRYPECGIACLDQLEQTLKRRKDEIAGVVIEPLVQAAAGMVTAPPGHLRRVRELTRRYDALLIADEVATGFGRTGRLFACEHEEVTPDLMAVAKGLTGGYLPLAATLTTERVYRAFLGPYTAFKTFFHGHSYTGNPLGCAAALANLKIFDRERTIERLQSTVAELTIALRQIASLPHVGQIRQCGLMAGIELVRNREKKSPYPAGRRTGYRVCREARRRGLLLRPLGDVIVLMPPLATSRSVIRRMAEIVGRSIARISGSASPG
ncbi:MAG: adenosylmethionine--8-amino-7-oxononanoate transaminase [Nitrospirae bacterium]|nr:adenosylmethionine--8-amino-7-oxononanoate transaminase [Nitrospirota bacterium]